MKGMREGLGDKAASAIVSATTYELTDATADSQVVTAQGSGADAFYFWGVPKFAAMVIRKVSDLGWKPTFILGASTSSVATALTPAGLERCVGLLTSAYMKDPTDPQWQDDAAYKEWRAFLAQWAPAADVTDTANVYGYSQAQCPEQVLLACGNDLSRQTIADKAWNLDFAPPMFQPGVRFSIRPGDNSAIKKLRLVRFDGRAWVPFGDPVGI